MKVKGECKSGLIVYCCIFILNGSVCIFLLMCAEKKSHYMKVCLCVCVVYGV